MSEEYTPCPVCGYQYTYPMDDLLVCSDCGHQWNPNEADPEESDSLTVEDANGNLLKDGDSVVVIKDLKVKGASKPIKGGTKVTNIKLTDGDHNIDCKIPGFGAMGLKSEFVKKVND